MKIKFFDESGFRLPEAGPRHYGFSSVGVPCIEVQRYLACPNITLICKFSGRCRWRKIRKPPGGTLNVEVIGMLVGNFF